MCVYDCKHPVWGGNGTCIVDETTERAACTCTDGFCNVDSMDNPSCVPRLALLIGYLAVAITGAATFAFLAISARQQRARSASITASTKAVTKLRLILLASVYVGGSTLVFCIGAVRLVSRRPSSSSLWWSSEIIQFYCVGVSPALVAAALSVSELWLGVLPSVQLLPADCLAARVVELDKEMRAFFWMASFSYAGMVLLGFTSFFVDPFLVLKIGDVVCVSGATVNGLCIVFVAANTQQVIRTAMKKAREASKQYYMEAERIMALQVSALLFATGIFVAAHLMKIFTTAGSSTPLIPAVTTHVISYAGLCLAILFVKLPSEQTSSSSGFSCIASVGARHHVRSAIFWVTGGRWGFRQTHQVFVSKARSAGDSNNYLNDETAKFQVNAGISPGVGSSVIPTEI